MSTYQIVRMYFEDEHDTEILERGLTLEEAQAHCSDPETSSSTALSEEAVARTAEKGPWFDGWREDRRR